MYIKQMLIISDENWKIAWVSVLKYVSYYMNLCGMFYDLNAKNTCTGYKIMWYSSNNGQRLTKHDVVILWYDFLRETFAFIQTALC